VLRINFTGTAGKEKAGRKFKKKTRNHFTIDRITQKNFQCGSEARG
jgi:hypothetical protein